MTWWRHVLVLGAATTLASATGMMALGRFVGPSLVVLDVAMLLGLWLLRRPGRSGVVVLAVFSLANLLLHGPIVAIQVGVPEAPASLVTGIGLGLSSLLVLVGSVPAWGARLGTPGVLTGARLAVGGVITVALVIGLASFLTRGQEPAQADDLRVTTSGLAVSPQRLETTAGKVTVALHNADPLFPRSFDVDDLDVHLIVPPRTTRRVRFTAVPGSYRFTDFVTATAATSGRLVVAAR